MDDKYQLEKGRVNAVATSVDDDEPRSRGRASTTTARICGLSRKIFIVIAVLLVVGLAVGLGVGLRPQSTASEPAVATPVTTTSSISTTKTRTATSTTSAAMATGTASTSCPNSNGTQFTASGYSYTIYCNSDIKLPVLVDLGRHYQPTFDACIQSCAELKRSDASAVYWVDYAPNEAGTCWCLGNTTRTAGATIVSAARNDLAWIMQ